MTHENTPSSIDGYPFDTSNLSEELIAELIKAVKNNQAKYKLADNVREIFDAGGQKPDDTMLLLSWSLVQMVNEGVHIDDVFEDSTEARTLLDQYLENLHEEPSEEVFDFGEELDELVIRAKEFSESL
jgi:hypothetical protein